MVSKQQKKALKYYQNPKKANKVIKRHIKKNKQVVYGAKAVNAHLPKHLHRHTEDWDVYTNTPARKQATTVERKLDKAYGGDFFFTEPALHPGTHKVKSHVTNREVADFSNPKGKVPFKTINGVRYVPVGYIKKSIKKTLKDPDSRYRHAKDREALQRLELRRVTKKRRKKRVENLNRKTKHIVNIKPAFGTRIKLPKRRLLGKI